MKTGKQSPAVLVLHRTVYFAALCGLFAFGWIDDDQWSRNIFGFCTCLWALVCSARLFAKDDDAPSGEHDFTLLYAMGQMLHMGLIVGLAGYGSFFLAGCCAWILSIKRYERAKHKRMEVQS